MVSSISLSKFFFLLVSLPLLLQRVPEGEKLQAEGIWARGNTELLFTKVRPCTEESVIPSAQILVSTDAGRSWTQRGPRLEGKDFAFIYERNGLVWLAGFHTAEFGADPFILVPTNPSIRLARWLAYTKWHGDGETLGVLGSDTGRLNRIKEIVRKAFKDTFGQSDCPCEDKHR